MEARERVLQALDHFDEAAPAMTKVELVELVRILTREMRALVQSGDLTAYPAGSRSVHPPADDQEPE